MEPIRDTTRMAALLHGRGNGTDRAESLRRSTESILTLPTLPTVASRLLQLADDEATSSAAMARLVSEDQVLTARLLKVANSSYYGFERRIATVNLAVLVLGFDAVRDLALTVSVTGMFRPGDSDAFDLSLFWEHSVCVGTGARLLARLLRWPQAGEAFTAGLLHDIGKVVLNQYQSAYFREALRLHREEGIPHLEAERIALGATHADVGGWLCRRWNLPEAICDAASFHHDPSGSREHPALAALIRLSDALAHRLGPPTPGEDGEPPPAEIFEQISSAGTPVRPEDWPDLERAAARELEKSVGLRSAWE